MSGWLPWSSCTRSCPRHQVPRLPARRGIARAAALSRVVGGALTLGQGLREAATLRRHARRALDALDVRLDHDGGAFAVPGRTGTLVVANHISWLDAVALLAADPVIMLAKREVADWPVAGDLVARLGTRFIDRENLRTLPRVVAELADLLRTGHSIAVFPQGITWCAGSPGGFRRAVFQAAVDARAPVRPVTVDYLQHGRTSTVAAFVGADTFAGSLRRVLRADGLTVRLRAHPPLLPGAAAADRRVLAAQAEALVRGGQLPGGPPVGASPVVAGSPAV